MTEKEEDEMLEDILTTPYAEVFRQFVKSEMELQPHESVLSIGCGPGFETAVLAEDISEQGAILGVDINEEVLDSAQSRCAELPQVSFELGDATDLPVPDDSYDVAVAKQVYQFVADTEIALAELRRVLKPGGRAVVVEKDIDARVIHSSDRDRMNRVKEVYCDAVQHPHLGSALVSLLPAAGLSVEEVKPRAIVHTEINEQVERGIEVQRGFLESSELFDPSEIEAWEQDLRNLNTKGEFLSCGTQFLHVARNPTQ